MYYTEFPYLYSIYDGLVPKNLCTFNQKLMYSCKMFEKMEQRFYISSPRWLRW